MNLWMYWENAKGSSIPPHIEKSMARAAEFTSYPTHIVTDKTIGDYITPPKLPNLKIAHKADVYRALLLHKYGGIWADADMIWLQNFDHLYSDTHATIFNKSGTEKDATRIEVIAVPPNSPIMEEWSRCQMAILEVKGKNIRWTDIGSKALTPVVRKYQERCKFLPIHLICPVEWNKSNTKDYMASVRPETLAITYFNSRNKGLPKSLSHLLR